jgi:hypothetical protein
MLMGITSSNINFKWQTDSACPSLHYTPFFGRTQLILPKKAGGIGIGFEIGGGVKAG